MPLPFLAIAAIGVGLTGVYKGGQAVSNNNRAKELVDDAQRIYDNAKRKLDNQKDETVACLEALGEVKLNSWSQDIGKFLPLFHSFKKVEIKEGSEINENLKLQLSDPNALENMQVASMKAEEILGAGAGALGAGALAGIASYGGAMMFASASTGTAIASLSGAAATNATLAWFGGGSLAAGGLGVAGGTAVLGGVVAAPVIAVAGFIMAAKSEENLAKAKKAYAEAENAEAQMEAMITALCAISDVAQMDGEFICEFSKIYQRMLTQLDAMRSAAYDKQKGFFWNRIRRLLGIKIKVDYRKLEEDEKQLLHTAWLMTQILYSALTTPILNENGDIDETASQKIAELQSASQNFLEAGA